MDTAFTAYKGKDIEAALDNVNTAYYSVYEESRLGYNIYAELSLEDREAVDARFEDLQGTQGRKIPAQHFSGKCAS